MRHSLVCLYFLKILSARTAFVFGTASAEHLTNDFNSSTAMSGKQTVCSSFSNTAGELKVRACFTPLNLPLQPGHSWGQHLWYFEESQWMTAGCMSSCYKQIGCELSDLKCWNHLLTPLCKVRKHWLTGSDETKAPWEQEIRCCGPALRALPSTQWPSVEWMNEWMNEWWRLPRPERNT